MVNISAVPINELDNHWGYIKGDIEKALKFCNEEMDIDDVHSQIEDGAVLPLLVKEGEDLLSVVTLEIVQKPLKKVVCIMTAGGEELDLWLDEIMKTVEILAKEQQADSIYINGRKGWLRKLERFNYKHAYTVLSKEVN